MKELYSQTEAGKILGISKQYIKELIKDKKIEEHLVKVSIHERKNNDKKKKKNDMTMSAPNGQKTKLYRVKIDLNEVKKYQARNKVENKVLNNHLELDELKERIIDDSKIRGNFKLTYITETKFLDFIIDNFEPLLIAHSFDKKLERLSSIYSYIYYYQLSYESKPLKDVKKSFENNINVAKKDGKDLLSHIRTIDYIPEGRITKTELFSFLLVMASPANVRLQSRIKTYDYKITKILKKLPFTDK